MAPDAIELRTLLVRPREQRRDAGAAVGMRGSRRVRGRLLRGTIEGGAQGAVMVAEHEGPRHHKLSTGSVNWFTKARAFPAQNIRGCGGLSREPATCEAHT
jgi:hypothetical protein